MTINQPISDRHSSTTERPIIFSDSLIRAILREQKNETRRVITPQPQRSRPILRTLGQAWSQLARYLGIPV